MTRSFAAVYADFQRNSRAWARAPESSLLAGGERRYIDRSDQLSDEMASAPLRGRQDTRAALSYLARFPDLVPPRAF